MGEELIPRGKIKGRTYMKGKNVKERGHWGRSMKASGQENIGERYEVKRSGV